MQLHQNLPRVLIVSVNALSETSNNGKTYASFFEGYPVEKLAQLYFHRELPSTSVARSFYRVSDEDVLRFILRRNSSLGTAVDSTTSADQLLSTLATRKLASSQVVRLARAAALGRVLQWGYPSVRAWVDGFSPEIIFFSGGNATHLYPLVERISLDYAAPIVNYITDDYVLPTEEGPLSRFARKVTRSHFLRLCSVSGQIYTIGEKMSAVYMAQYGIKSTTAMNLVSIPERPAVPTGKVHGRPLLFVYAGGLHLNRWRSLAKLGSSLDRHGHAGTPAELRIYTATELDDEMSRSLAGASSIRVCGPLNQEGLEAVYQSADVLVHAESFADSDRAATRLSVSTKIPEYLATGKPILAVGPGDIASIEYLASANAAYVITSLDEALLDSTVEQILADGSTRQQKAEAAYALALSNHDGPTTRRRIWGDLTALAHRSTAGSGQRERPQ